MSPKIDGWAKQRRQTVGRTTKNFNWDVVSYRIFAHGLKQATNTVKQVVEMIVVFVIVEMSACFTQTMSLVIAYRLPRLEENLY